jgi:LemA protein
MTILAIIIVILAVFIIGVIVIYNNFIRSKNRVQEAWADIDVQLKRRYDLIPNLVETVKGYTDHERETLENITKARASAIHAEEAGSVAESLQAENALSSTLRTLFAVSENYPELKANANFLELQRELSDTENKIQASRRFYNSTVRDFNTMLETFPSNTIANIFKFTAFDLFDLEDQPEERENVKVEF